MVADKIFEFSFLVRVYLSNADSFFSICNKAGSLISCLDADCLHNVRTDQATHMFFRELSDNYNCQDDLFPYFISNGLIMQPSRVLCTLESDQSLSGIVDTSKANFGHAVLRIISNASTTKRIQLKTCNKIETFFCIQLEHKNCINYKISCNFRVKWWESNSESDSSYFPKC